MARKRARADGKHTIHIRVTSEEHEAFRVAAQRTGAVAIGTWLRMLGVQAARQLAEAK
jgi:hypothetical protein